MFTAHPFVHLSGSSSRHASGVRCGKSDGCVFLPAAGQWDRHNDIFDDDTGLYWSSTPSDSDAAYYQRFIPWKVYQNRIYRDHACTVRLVTDVK